MIISRTPFRISFFGGGTDYEDWYQENGGAVLVTTIDKYCYISCRWLPPFFEHKTRIAWSQIELVKSHEEIKHPAVRAVLKHLNIVDGVEIHHDGDLPARTGLGSSSTFTVGLLHSLHGLKSTMRTKRQLATEAIEIERRVLKESGGVQDQVAASFGGFNRIVFSNEQDFAMHPVIMDRERLTRFQSHLMLYFTGFARSSSEIAREQAKNMTHNKRQLARMCEMVDDALSILTGRGDLIEFGKLLAESWKLKRGLAKRISNERVDRMYEAALEAGAIGGKLLGAGGGGFVLLFARPEEQPKIRERLRDFLLVPFRFESHGSQIIFYDVDSKRPPAKIGEDQTKAEEEAKAKELSWTYPGST